MKKTYTLLLLLLAGQAAYSAQAPWVGADLNGQSCRGGEQGYGPYDYTNADDRKHMPIVEKRHFSSDVENHLRGSSGRIADDLDYTLRAIPNHHRALLSAIRYQLKLNQKLLSQATPLPSPAECYLQRAIHFRPDDAAAISLYAYYLKEVGLLDKADEVYQKAVALAPKNAKIAYSYSLLLIELKQYDKAVAYAKQAYANGKPPASLRRKLIKLGAWQEAADK